MIRIAITGPESCGKTSLAEALGLHYNVNYVPEFSRDFLLERNGKYNFEDLEIIARGQKKLFDQFSGPLMIADTEMLVMYIWSMVVYGKVDPFITHELKKQKFDLYILCDTDVPWEFDPLRENEYDRDELFQRYYKKLREMGVNFMVVKGSAEERLKTVIERIDSMTAAAGLKQQ